MSLQSEDFGLRPHDNFTVIRHFELTQHHLDILNRLFTPLTGPNAIGVYHYLNQFVAQQSSDVLTHYIIMSELKINLIDFRKSMDLLEAIGLVQSYAKHDEQLSSFVYKLVQPPSAKQFFNDPMLSVYLFSEVSKQRYIQLKQYFESHDEVDLTQYQNITRKFTDVFKVPRQSINEDTQHIQGEETYDGVDLSEIKFDFELLYDLLESHFVSKQIITKDAKALIIQLATLYGLTPEAMKRIILKSITSAQELSFEELRKQARSYYLIEHEQQYPSLQVKDNDAKASISQTTDSTVQEDDSDGWLEQLETTSPIDMLVSWSESEPTFKQKLMVEELIEREKLPFGVINILLQFVMLKEDMKLPKSYIFEVASNWKKLGIKTAKQAYEHAKKVNQPKSNQSSGEKGKTTYRQQQLPSREMTPKWLEERDNPQYQNKDTVDEDFERDKEAFLKELKETWKEGDE